MTKQVQRRRGTSTQHTGFTGADGEISVNTTNKSIHVHDGATAGGFEAARADLLNVDDADVATAISGGTVPSLTITSADINGGTIDGTTIGANSAAAGTFTTLSATTLSSAVDLNSQALTNANIDSGAIDGTTIGASSAAAITGTTITGTSFVSSGDMTFGDNDKAIFGAGSDLQIFHNPAQGSFIEDAGAGNLILKGTSVVIDDSSGDRMATFVDGGAVSLNFAASTKLATTATGVDVTGTVTADGMTVDGATTIKSGAAASDVALSVGSSGTAGKHKFYAGGDVAFTEDTGTTAKFFWDASAESLGIGTTSPSSASNNAENLVINDSAGNSGVTIRTEAASGYSSIYFADSASYTVGRIEYQHGGDDMLFYTNASEAVRINSGGSVLVNKTSSSLPTVGHEFFSNGAAYHTRDNGAVLYVNRLNGDGTLVGFYQDTVLEGRINVSGTTVSLIGGHLARWSQLNDGAKDEAIVKGTVLTNLDQMAVWHHEAVAATYYAEGDELPEITPSTYYTEDDTLPEGVSVGDEKTAAVYAQIGDEKTPAVDAYTEDNEQLNCMAVSSVEGDANVAGVFVNWDEEDDFNDMNIAMTGDMVIRIAQGTTVARGDLLMSAGDGTAKPQGDDIVRSKTIAKVTSTYVSHTYDDGSYLVPCVLMAC